jgi:hypothetical protein
VDSALPSLRLGTQLNGFQPSQVQVTGLDWTDRSEAMRYIREDLLVVSKSSLSRSTVGIDYLLASDVIWVDFLVPSLVDTIADWMQIPGLRRDSILDEDKDKERDESNKGDKKQEEASLKLSTVQSTVSSYHHKPPILLLAYQFRSTRSDELLFGSLDRLGLSRKRVTLDRLDDEDEDAVELDPKFRRPNLCIWKIWKS